MLRLLKNFAKASIRAGVNARLSHFPLSAAAAEWYAEQFRRWPAVFAGLDFQTQRQLPAGMQMNLGIVDIIERTLLTTGAWDPIIRQTMTACLKPGDVFLDVGANIGYFSLLASRLVGDSGRVFSFEPSARALSKLTAHICLNECSNITVCSQAMGEKPGTERLNWAPSSNIGGSTIARGASSQGRSETIAVRRLDDVCRELQIAPSFIKLDVEGFELFALRGARETLSRHHPVVVCELTNRFLKDHGQSGAEMLHFMRELNYHAWLISLNEQGTLTAQLLRPEDTPVDQAEVLFSTVAPDFCGSPLSSTETGSARVSVGDRQTAC